MLIKTIKFSFLLIFLSCTFNNNVNAERKKLILVGDYWCPYNCSEDINYQGFLVDVTRRALYIYGIDIEYKLMPWHETLTEIKKGSIDGIIGISQTKGLDVITTNLPLEYSTTTAFIRTDTDWMYDGLASLRGKKLGIVMDYNLTEDISNFVGMNYTTNPGMFIIEDGKNAVIDSITNLIDGTSDVYIEDRRVVESYIKEHDLSHHIKNAGKTSKDPLPLYIAFNSKIPHAKEYIKFLEEGIASLKATGEYEDLRVKYKMDSSKKG
jgi:polar amino acid transport system substrate-binding protein